MRPQGLRKYTHHDFDMIASWYEQRGLPVPLEASLSDMGWIADDRVVGFLYVTPSNVALIEGIIANPDTVPSLRAESMRKLSGFLIDYALLMGYTNLVAITEHPSIAEACKAFGFTESNHRVFLLNEK